MNPTPTLIASRARIADPAHWTKEALARDAAGCVTEPDDPAAVAFCPRGAVLVEAGPAQAWGEFEAAAMAALAAQLPSDYFPASPPASRVVTFNNSRKHADVIALFDRAIAAQRPRTDIGALTALLDRGDPSVEQQMIEHDLFEFS